MININSKLPSVGSSIFSVMTQLSNQNGAINLAQGFPNLTTDKALIKEINKTMEAGANQYAPMIGLLELREIIGEKTNQFYNSNFDVDAEITITSGATQAIFTAISAFISPGDEVIVFEPAYDSYAPSIKLFGGVVKSFALSSPNFDIDWEMVKKLFTAQTKMIIINSPHNPTGRVLNQDDINSLIKLTKNTDIIILSDEVYANIIFDGNTHHSLALYPELVERTLIVSSFGKILNATGWKVGYVIATKHLMNEFRKVHQFNVFSTNTPMQAGIAQFLKTSDVYEKLASEFQIKRDYFRDLLAGSKFTLLPCQGTYFQCVSYEKINELNDADFAELLVKDYKVASIPISAFYSGNEEHRILRFCFAKTNSTLEQAVENLLKL